MLGKKRSTFSREEFQERELRRSGAFGSWAVAYSTIKALDNFAKTIGYDDVDQYFVDIKTELKKEPDSDIPMRMLDDFASYLTKVGRCLQL